MIRAGEKNGLLRFALSASRAAFAGMEQHWIGSLGL